MLLERRKFLRTGLIFGATAALFYANAPSAFAHTLADDRLLSDEVLRDPLYSFTRETFAPYVGGYFVTAGTRGQKIGLKLLSAEAYTPKSQKLMPIRPAVQPESFSLEFKAEAPLPRLSSIYPVSHGALGDFNLFLTRRDAANGDIFYEAVFSRVR